MKENKWKLESRREWQYYVMDSAVIQTTYFIEKHSRAAHHYIKKMKKGKRSQPTQNTPNTCQHTHKQQVTDAFMSAAFMVCLC